MLLVGLAWLAGCDPLYSVDDLADGDGRADAGPDARPGDPLDAGPDPGPLAPLDPAPLDCARIAERPPMTPLGPHPPSAPLDGVCAPGDPGPSHYTWADPDGPYAVHVIAVGEAIPETPGGAVVVRVRATAAPAVLVLVADSPTAWELAPDADARVAGVIVAGPQPRAVQGSPVAVQSLDGDHFCAFGAGWEARHQVDDGAHHTMITAIREALGQRETAFQGCARGRRFTVPHSDSPETEPPPLAPIEAEAGEVLGCGDIARESVRCILAAYEGTDLIGLDTGRTCPIERMDPGTPYLESMAWRGAALWRCGPSGLTRLRLDTLKRDVPEVLCGWLVDDGDGFLAAEPGTPPDRAIQRFDGPADLIAGRSSRAFAPEISLSVFAAHDGILYGAHFSTDRIERFDLAERRVLAPLILEDFDARIHGFDVLPEGVMVLTSDTLHRFDRATGAALDALPFGRDQAFFGLVCQSD